MPDIDIPVLIVGAGPSGATLSLLLVRQDVRSIVISRHTATANTPRAHIFNQRAMEVLRDAELESRVSKLASDAREMAHTSWLHSLNGQEYGRLWSWGNDPARKGVYELCSPCAMSDLPQSFLEPALVDEAKRLGADVRFNTELVSFEQDHEVVRTTVRDRGSGECVQIISKYLIGADGARSPVLEQLGIPVDGRQVNDAFNVHIKAELSKYFVHRPGSLNWILNPDAPNWSAVGNFRMVRPWNEFVVSMHPSTKDGKTFDPRTEDILQRLHQMIGDEAVPITILSAYRWTINDQVAQKWQKGRVLCIGDATHRHPPINGLGSNTCISDAFNLAWKLAYVLKDWAADGLLDTLTTERKPVGDAIVRRANDGMEVHRELWQLMGLTTEDRQRVTDALKSASQEGAELREKLQKVLEKADDEVQAIGIQMNQIYLGSSATYAEPDDRAPEFSNLNFLKEVMISTYPGYHLPHVWLAKNGQSERVSILDLAGKGKFTLFTGIGGSAWLDAAKRITEKGKIEVKAYSIGFGCDFLDAYRDWKKLRGVGEDGAVLVRPDHFVAWRSVGPVSNPVGKLGSVLEKCLCYG